MGIVWSTRFRPKAARKDWVKRMGTIRTTGNRKQRRAEQARRRRGSALIPALITVSMLAMLGLSMLSAGLDGARSVNHQSDEYRLTSAVESVGILAAENLWSGYLRDQGGVAGNILSFRNYMNFIGIQDAGPGGTPGPLEGTSLLEMSGLPVSGNSREFNNVNVQALQIVRRDDGEATRLYVTVSANTTRGEGFSNPVLNRAIQLVYTIEPATFDGFDYGVLTNNVNCVFCHAVVDSVERYNNTDPSKYGTFKKVKVGSLESLMLRHNPRPAITDWDADSHVAGPVYVRGDVTDHNGSPISNWGALTFKSKEFDGAGNLLQDQWGDMVTTNFDPASLPYGPGENLYLDYPLDYSAQPDGQLPTSFPPPFPDTGGIDPSTGQATTAGAGNRVVDPGEFYALANNAEGSILAGVINVSDPSFVIDTSTEYAAALFTGNASSLSASTSGNVVLSGTQDNPIHIDGDIAIDGDLVINGYVKGSGAIYVSGNVYVPTDLRYLDGSTFGISPSGDTNALALAAGGNIMLGDYLKPSIFTSPAQYDIVAGDASGDWNFALAELSLFNRTEWAKTQPFLPGHGEDKSDPSSWTVPNPNYVADYMPRYYNYGEGDEIPIYNLGEIYFDGSTGTWIGDEEVPLSWDPDLLTMLDPNDTDSPLLFDQTTGAAVAAVMQLSPEGGWLSDEMQKAAIEYFESIRPANTPMQIDSLLYTNNAIFGIVHRSDVMRGQLLINGSLVCADLGILAPGYRNGQVGAAGNVPGSPFAVGLQLNYDKRLKDYLTVTNPNQITIKRTFWNPTANLL